MAAPAPDQRSMSAGMDGAAQDSREPELMPRVLVGGLAPGSRLPRAGSAEGSPASASVDGAGSAPAPARLRGTASRASHNARAILERARTLWPGLHPRQLAGTRGDPGRIVRLVGKQSTEAPEVLLEMLTGPSRPVSD